MSVVNTLRNRFGLILGVTTALVLTISAIISSADIGV